MDVKTPLESFRKLLYTSVDDTSLLKDYAHEYDELMVWQGLKEREELIQFLKSLFDLVTNMTFEDSDNDVLMKLIHDAHYKIEKALAAVK